MKRDPYCCPACGYETRLKWHMQEHLYRRKQPCPQMNSRIELTDEIKEFIIKNRVWIAPSTAEPPAIPSQPSANTTVTNNTIHNYNIITNFIGGIPSMDKIKCYLDHTNTKMIGLDDRVTSSFVKQVRRLETDPPSFIMKENDFLESINGASTNAHVKNMNIIFNKKDKKISIYTTKWKTYLPDMAVKMILTSIQENYFDTYECYLIRKLHDNDINDRLLARVPLEELLIEYYTFIAYFDLTPFIKEKTNTDILNATFGESDDTKSSGSNDEPADEDEEDEEDHDEEEDMTISDKYTPKFEKARQSITKTERRRIQKAVLTIIKNNCEASLGHLNQKVLDLFRMDETFKAQIMKHRDVSLSLQAIAAQ